MFYALDRFEGDFAVFEALDNRKTVNVKRALLPENAKEGDIFVNKDGRWLPEDKKTKERKKIIEDKFNSLWN